MIMLAFSVTLSILGLIAILVEYRTWANLEQGAKPWGTERSLWTILPWGIIPIVGGSILHSYARWRRPREFPVRRGRKLIMQGLNPEALAEWQAINGPDVVSTL